MAPIGFPLACPMVAAERARGDDGDRLRRFGHGATGAPEEGAGSRTLTRLVKWRRHQLM